MQRVDGRLVLSPTDLTKHVACPHITTLDLQALDAGAAALGAKAADDALNLVFEKGLAHEADYLRHLRDRGLSITEIDGFGHDREAAEAATLAAMREGVDVVYQATLYDGAWVGHADFLLRTERPSDLGPWSYDIADTKLARRLKVPALLQMAMYAARLAQLQGVAPQRLVVVTGDKEQHPWRLVDVAPYAARRRDALLRAIEAGATTEPAPCPQCAQCRWQDRCAREWTDTDDLVQVAGLRADQRDALRANGIHTMAALAAARLEDVSAVLSTATAERLHQQATLQVAERESGHAAYLLLPPQVGRGLQRLPEPSPGDVYLDFEGDPWADDGRGREYLAGLWNRNGAFTEFWAHDTAGEKRLTEDLLDELMRRWQADPGMHVYHYAPYERTALERLTGRHGTREAELDQLLRGERLVDLYAVVRQGLRISKPSYSIKKLEDFYWGHTRGGGEGDVSDAMTSVVEYERWLTERDGAILARIRDYNKDDVESTHDLHAWLEERRDELALQGHELSRPVPPELREVGEDERAETELAEALVEAGHELLAGCVGWHRREARPGWWEFFRYETLDTQELVDDRTALGGLSEPEYVEDVVSARTGRVTSRVWRYRFPPQDFGLRLDTVADVDTHEGAGTLVDIDPAEGWAHVRRGVRHEPLACRGFGPGGPLNDRVLRDSIADTGRRVLSGESSTAARLVARVVPASDVLAVRGSETPAEAVVRVGSSLEGEVLAVQGPPGTGKTYAAVHLIEALLDAGKRVGVTALSHSVIRHVLEKTGRPALHKVTEAPDDARGGLVQLTGSNDVARDALLSGEVSLVGGTAWLWAREDMRDSVDVLVIDEAGQFSLANAVAAAPAARSLVLLGDPQQLTQPSQATHPYAAGISALEHLIGDHDTMPPDRGIFLGTTFRMHPDVTRFVSELSYEGRLASAPDRERQEIGGEGPLSGSGLRWVPVAHEGCSADSEEEAAVVAGLVKDLLVRSWTDTDGVTHPMTEDDVLVVAPFNAHVARLRVALPDGIRVGTVDRFQGREAPVVVYSMASSSAADAPRGVDFLFDLHRFNVAVSRARAMSIVVASPALLDAEVHSPEQLRAVNALCRYADEAVHLSAH
jgi:predicted RecB family nuclease